MLQQDLLPQPQPAMSGAYLHFDTENIGDHPPNGAAHLYCRTFAAEHHT